MKRIILICAILTLLLVSCAENENMPSDEVGNSSCMHDWSEWQSETVPSCTEDGSIFRLCEKCDARDTATVKAMGHKIATKGPERPDCLVDGYMNYEYCERCSYIKYDTIKALGHTYKDRRCIRCGISTQYSVGLSMDVFGNNGAVVKSVGECMDSSVLIEPYYNGKAVLAIGENAFSGNLTVTSIEIPDSVNEIGERAFYQCMNLRLVFMPDGLTEIKDSTFERCSYLEHVTVPENVESIGNNAFYFCERMKSVKIPASVKSIGVKAFDECTNLVQAEIEDPASWKADVDLSDPKIAAEWLKTRAEKSK